MSERGAVRWAALVAGKGGRRSRLAREVAAALSARGVAVAGFAQETTEPREGVKAIALHRLPRGEVVALARSGPDGAPGEAAGACALVFDPAALARARAWIAEDAPRAAVLVVDGLGKLELGGGGHRAALDDALAAGRVVVLALRDDQLFHAVEALGLDEPLAAYTEGEGEDARRAFLAEVERAAAG